MQNAPLNVNKQRLKMAASNEKKSKNAHPPSTVPDYGSPNNNRPNSFFPTKVKYRNPFTADGDDDDDDITKNKSGQGRVAIEDYTLGKGVGGGTSVKCPQSVIITDGDGKTVTEPTVDVVSLDSIAARLLKDRYILTALELHMELIESGRELSRLRDFFSNPANFERTRTLAGTDNSSSPRLIRTSSVQTFDSLDFARYSDDGDRNESDRVAVLEFEIRAARETIKSLRAALTHSAENEPDASIAHGVARSVNVENQTGSGGAFVVADEPMRPHERRAINFLVNEHLTRYGYKLTAVTFSEENEDGQDFDDWDDVGINIAKPPDLVHLYRDYGQHVVMPVMTCNVATETDVIEEGECTPKLSDFKLAEFFPPSRTDENLNSTNTPDQRWSVNETISADKNDGASRISNAEQAHVLEQVESPSEFMTNRALISRPAEDCEVSDADEHSIEWKPNDNKSSNVNETDGIIEHTAKIEQERQESVDVSATSNIDMIDISARDRSSSDEHAEKDGSQKPVSDITERLNNGDVRRGRSKHGDSSSWEPTQRITSTSFQRVLLETAFVAVGHDNHIIQEVSLSCDDDVVLALTRCLPRVIPNVLLARRDELIPLIVIAATLHPDPKQRDELLSHLFNLIKRPDTEQRRAILAGCIVFARHAGAGRVESELLPQAWEQIEHRHAERRLLVAEACGALAPYIPDEMRSSLVLSILTQMLEDKAEEVREAVVRSLGILVAFVSDVDKYQTASQLLFTTFGDSSDKVVRAVQDVLLPSVAVWSTELGRLDTHLVQAFVDNVEKLVKSVGGHGASIAAGAPNTGGTSSGVVLDQKRFGLYMQALQQLTSFLFLFVLTTGPFANDNKLEPEKESAGSEDVALPAVVVVGGVVPTTLEVLERLPKAVSDLYDLSVIMGDAERLATLITRYETFISEEWYELWDAFNWVAGEFIPQLLTLSMQLDTSQPTVVCSLAQLFQLVCRTFGQKFTATKVIPRFQLMLKTDAVPASPSTGAGTGVNTVPASIPLYRSTAAVFATGVLTAFTLCEEDRKQLHTFLTDFIIAVSKQTQQHLPLQQQLDITSSIRVTFSELATVSAHHELLLRILWESVVDTSAPVRATAGRLFDSVIPGFVADGSVHLVSTRVVPALVTLASDTDVAVRVATVSAFGTIAEMVSAHAVLEKVYMQFQSFMDDPVYRGTADSGSMYVELIRTFGRIGPTAEPRFRDDFILPRLTALAAQNQLVTNERRKTDVALQLFETFGALSCCFISDQLVQEVMLPGLRCLLADLKIVAPDHVAVVISMIREFEVRMESSSTGSGVHGQTTKGTPEGITLESMGEGFVASGEAMKSKVLNRFKDVKERAAHSNFSKMLQQGKK